MSFKLNKMVYLTNSKFALVLITTLFHDFVPLIPVEAAPDNKGTEYIIGYMENFSPNSKDPLNPELYVTTMKTTTVNVQVTAPLYTNNVINESFTVIAGEVKTLSFDFDFRVTGSTLANKGLWVQADQEIVIYGVSPEHLSNDAFLGIPTDVLGTEYYIITWWPATRQCELLVVGVNDSTTVNVLLSEALGSSNVTYNGNGYYAGDTIVVNINRYQTLQLTSDGDLTGSYITSDKIISVFSGNQKTQVTYSTSADHIVEQWPPVSTFGKSFATVPIPGRTVGDKFKIVASEDNTYVTVTGSSSYSTSLTLFTAGSHQQLDIGSEQYCHIEADKPILVAQICKSQHDKNEKSDPMMVMIPPIELFAADYTFATPQYSKSGDYTNYFMFVVKDSQKNGLLVDGAPFPASTNYISIPGTELVGGYIQVSHGTHTVRHTLTTSVFGAYLFGTASWETYGFPTGSRFAPINTVCTVSTSETGDGIDNDCDGLLDEESCPDGIDDDGDGTADEDCATPFPIDGNWADWTGWSPCSVTCSETGSLVSGTTVRTRTCTNPAPQYEGQQCSGVSSDTLSCSTAIACPELTTTSTTPETKSTSTTSTTTTPETTSTSTTSTTTTLETTSTSVTSMTTTPETTSTSVTSMTTTPETTSTSTTYTTTTPETTSTSTTSTTTTPETTSTSTTSTTTPETTSTSTTSTTTTPETTSTSTASTTTTPETTSTSTTSTTTPETTSTSTTSTTTTPETTSTSTASTTTTPETRTPETTTTPITSTTTTPEITSTSTTSTTTTPETTSTSVTSMTTTPETTSTSVTSMTTTSETTSTSMTSTTEIRSNASTTTTVKSTEEAAILSTAAAAITETALLAIITASIIGPCCALSAMFALRKRLRKRKQYEVTTEISTLTS